MQDNSLTFAVDTANTGSTTNKTYTRLKEEIGRSTYADVSVHLSDDRDTLHLYATDAKPSGNDRGVRRCSVKLTDDQEVPNRDGSGNLVKPLIIEASFAIPEGTEASVVLEARQRLIAILDDDDVMDDLCAFGEV